LLCNFRHSKQIADSIETLISFKTERFSLLGNGPLSNEIVIVGAHEDSINERGNPETNVAPGADDDGKLNIAKLI
jgi:Zn-dependent M28 family amino/carboxypeptidase